VISLRPYTLFSSTQSLSSVLLTDTFDKYLFVCPLDKNLVLAQILYSLLIKHFKIQSLNIGKFTLKNINYLCVKKEDCIIEINAWNDFLWSSKRGFNSFLNPEDLIKMYLMELYFPIFKQTEKFIQFGKKDKFILNGYPKLFEGNRVKFVSQDSSSVGMTQPQIVKFIRFMKSDFRKIIQDFKELHHDKLYSDIKYQISLFPNLRNEYWEEVKKCFSSEYKEYIDQELWNYSLRL